MALLPTIHVPATTGGLNTVDAVSSMAPTDAVYKYNLLSGEFGDKVRGGFKQWGTGYNEEMRTTMPYHGSAGDGRSDRLFVVGQSGIYDATAFGQTSPSILVAFPVTNGRAGYGVFHNFTTVAGHFLIYCDEMNGLYVYTENTQTWAAVAGGVTQPWAGDTSVLYGDQVVAHGNVYTCTTAGVTAADGLSSGPSGTGTGIADGSATWNYVSAKASSVIGPSLADQENSLTCDPSTFVFVTVWKSRLWFAERDSSRAWYLDVNSLYGTANSFNFGTKMRQGGPLVGLWSWSYDGGSGMDALLVAISTAGDIVIYQGTDPTSALTFGIVGTWSAGGLPSGRRVVTEDGGEMLVISALGAIPLSKLVAGANLEDPSQFATKKVHNLLNLLVSQFKALDGWFVTIHPEDNALLIGVPQPNGYSTMQLAMSFTTKGWSQYRDLPILSAGTWNGQLYFGTADGRVCLNTGYVDNVRLSDPTVYDAIAWSVLPAFINGGNMRQKQIQMVRPSILSGMSAPILQAVAKYDYDTSEPADTSGVGSGSGWDSGLWDVATWAGDYQPYAPIIGATGLGRAFSVAIRGQAVSRTIYVGCDIMAQEGGEL